MKRPKVITFDIGHTLIFPCFDEFIRLVEKHFGVKFTTEELRRTDSLVRYVNGTGSSVHFQKIVASQLIYYSGGMVNELLSPRLSDTAAVMNFLEECEPVQDSWFCILTKDAVPCLEMLKAKGFRLGVISNAHGKVMQNVTEAGIDKYLDFVVDSGLVGYEKPDARIFKHVHELAGIRPDELLHIGESVRSDVLGALNVGSQAALYDPDLHVYTGVLPQGTPSFRSLMAFAESFCPAE